MSTQRKYFYKAVSQSGEIIDGSLDGHSTETVSTVLKEVGLRPLFISLDPLRESFLHREIGRPKSSLKLVECKLFCETTAMMLDAGMRLDEAMLAAKTIFTNNKRLATFAQHLHYKLRLGESFSLALAEKRFQFPEATIGLIKSGEESSQLEYVLDACARAFERKIEYRSAIVQAATYPFFVLLVALIAIAVLSLLVAPQLIPLFQSMEAPVPSPIALLAGFGALLTNHTFAAFGTIMALAFVTLFFWHSTATHQTLQRLLFFAPLLRHHAQWAAAGRFATSIRLGRLAGVQEEPLAISAIMASNCPFSASNADICIQMLRQGNRLSDWVKQSGYFPQLLVQLLQTAEDTGAYTTSLKIVETEAERVLQNGIERISSILAPCLILIIGALIGSIVFSVFSSMNNLGSLLT